MAEAVFFALGLILGVVLGTFLPRPGNGGTPGRVFADRDDAWSHAYGMAANDPDNVYDVEECSGGWKVVRRE